ncbi:N-acetylmuramoyl-L-alanine amidase [Evansella sp. AB-rgal1]|uniref:N-acetylmuramoyl-L-alanine amidase n=1 Tax=Evansella sp. AB-rgal1 TaxID=3242696 RepID=UPI00359CE70F
MKKASVLLIITAILFTFLFNNPDDNIVSASSVDQGEITATSLNVRNQPNTNGRIIASLTRGSKVDLYERSGSWYMIKVNNQWGYIHGDFVKVVKSNISEITGSGEVTATRLNIRSSANTNSGVIGNYSRGARVDLYGKTGDWWKVKHNNQWGFIHSDFVREIQQQQTIIHTSINSSVNQGEVTATRLNVRQSASTNSHVIGSVTKGAKVELHEKTDQWYKINLNNAWGYVHGDFIKLIPTNTNTPPSSQTSDSIIETGDVTVARLNVRESNSTSSSIIGSLIEGAKVDIYEKAGVWSKIKIDESWGWIHSSYVKVTNQSQESLPVISDNLRGKTIFIDPGHGGRDPGAFVNGIGEKVLVLDISNKLKTKLEQAGATVIMSRVDDTALSLSQRVNRANNSKADIFISVHLNSWSGSSASGVETFYNSVLAGSNSQRLANLVQSQLVKGLHLRDRGIRDSNLQVIRFTRMPSILLELGFMTNPSDFQKIVNEQDALVNEIYNGIDLYFKN